MSTGLRLQWKGPYVKVDYHGTLPFSAGLLLNKRGLDLPDDVLREIALHIQEGVTIASFCQVHRRSHAVAGDIVHASVNVSIWESSLREVRGPIGASPHCRVS